MTHILLVEDDLWLGETYQLLFTKAGFRVDWRVDGYQAMEAVDQQKPDIIVLDFILPWANGLQLLQELVSHYDLQSIPVLLCSNALSGISVEDLAPYGVVDVIDKTTTTPRQLLRAVQGIVHAKI
jgi:DNA-binding response OmpR family regulator